jgi:hypothetical protein
MGLKEGDMLQSALSACYVWSQYYALVVCAIAFLILALVHFLRVVYRMNVTVGEWKVQMWVSYVAFIVSLVLSLWMFAITIW